MRSIYFLSIAAFFASLLQGTIAFADNEPAVSTAWGSIKIDWSCPHTDKEFPDPGQLSIRFNRESGEIDLSAFKDFINQLSTRYPTIDFHACLTKSTDNIENDFKFAELGSPNTDTLLSRLMRELRLAVANYGSLAYQNGALSPIEPGKPRNPPLENLELDYLFTPSPEESCGETIDSNFLYSEVLDRLQPLPMVMNPECGDKISAKFAQLLLDTLPDHFQCERSPILCKKRKAAVRAVGDRLIALGMLHNNPDPGADPGSCPPPSPTITLSKVARSLSPAMPCVALKPGESQVVQSDPGTGLIPAYTLTRDSRKNYSVRVNLQFDGSTLGVKDQGKQHQAEDNMRALTRDCFGRANELMRGPHGERITLGVFDDKDRNANIPEPPASLIHIQPPGFRDDSQDWDEHTDCAVITHEVMHLLGLVDEYREEALAVSPETQTLSSTADEQHPAGWNCRIISPLDSIMNDHEFAYDSTNPVEQITYCTCKLPAGSTENLSSPFDRGTYDRCRQAQELSRRTGECAPGTEETQDWEDPLTTTKLPQGISQGGSHEDFRYALKMRLEPMVKKSILYPAHFRVITQPGCESANHVYYTCAREAYKTSRENFGTDSCAASLPPECTRGDDSWLK